jgi:hypothetical protein
VKPPSSLVLVTLAAGVLGAGLAWTGLVLRLFPGQPSPFGPWGWASGAGPRLVTDAQLLAWPMVAVGCAWLGIVLGLWMRLGWVRRVGLVLSALSALALGTALLLTLPAFAGLMSPSMGRWLASDPSADGG